MESTKLLYWTRFCYMAVNLVMSKNKFRRVWRQQRFDFWDEWWEYHGLSEWLTMIAWEMLMEVEHITHNYNKETVFFCNEDIDIQSVLGM